MELPEHPGGRRIRATPDRRRCAGRVLGTVLLGLMLLLGVAACGLPTPGQTGQAASQSCPSSTSGSLPLTSDKGLNYGTPPGPGGEYLGTTWLRSDMGSDNNWSRAQVGLKATLPFIEQEHLGRVLRVFVGLDQIMVWNHGAFQRLDPAGVAHFRTALQLFQSYGFKVIVVLFHQEERASPGNFRYWALDGQHARLRAGYLKAAREFVSAFRDSSTIAAWDLFNEPYNSLSTDGGLRTPPAPDPVTAGYPEQVVHQWMEDLYHAAKCAAPEDWFTFSDTTALVGHHPNPALYSNSVDFYDIHMYQPDPYVHNWKSFLKKPFILGEVGAPRPGGSLVDPTLNSRVVHFWLTHARQAGAAAVLVEDDKGAVYTANLTRLTPTGVALSASR